MTTGWLINFTWKGKCIQMDIFRFLYLSNSWRNRWNWSYLVTHEIAWMNYSSFRYFACYDSFELGQTSFNFICCARIVSWIMSVMSNPILFLDPSFLFRNYDVITHHNLFMLSWALHKLASSSVLLISFVFNRSSSLMYFVKTICYNWNQ